MPRYRKRPVEIEAIQWTGGNWPEIAAFTGGEVQQGPRVWGDAIEITTLEGIMRANVGDWIIRGVKGELYPCKPDIFEATYDEVTSDATA